MDTFFASAELASAGSLHESLNVLSENPVINRIMEAACGLLAILNEQRQILTVNDSFLKSLGIDDAGRVFGLRPGEAIQCIHADDPPHGCGTTKYCSSCGAAIAIVASQETEEPQERLCAATVRRKGTTVDLCFKVRSTPLSFMGKKFILLFLQDITNLERWAAMERAFFHDINNVISSILGASDLLDQVGEISRSNILTQIKQSARRLANEVAIQRSLSESDLFNYHIICQNIPVAQLITELQDLFAIHPIALKKRLELPKEIPYAHIKTDPSLALRVLTNMLTNAFEATEEGGKVRLWIEEDRGNVTFSVWNGQAIPENISLRVFQRHFTTKQGKGRGLGTYSMKLLGEEVLGGKVTFSSSPAKGTVFRFILPLSLLIH